MVSGSENRGVVAERLGRGLTLRTEICARRPAFERARAAIQEVSKVAGMLLTVRTLRKYTFALVRCERDRTDKNLLKYWCTPDELAADEDRGNSTGTESEAEECTDAGYESSGTLLEESEMMESGSESSTRNEGESEEESESEFDGSTSMAKASGSESDISTAAMLRFKERSVSASKCEKSSEVKLGEEQEISFEAFEELFGSDVSHWLTVRASTYGSASLTKQHAQLVGLTEAKRIEYNGTEDVIREESTGYGADFQDVPMLISADRIFYFSGDESIKKALPNGANISELQPGCFYGSTMDERRNSSPNTVPKWHMLLMYTLKRHSNGDKDNSGTQVDSGDVEADCVVRGSADGQTECILSSEYDHVYLDRIIKNCMEKPNHVRRSDNPWCRPPSTVIKGHLDVSERIFCRSGTFECAKCAILNGIAMISGREYASDIALQTGRMEVRHLSDLSQEVRSKIGVFSLDWKINPEDWDKTRMYDANWLCTEATGVLIVNLIGCGGFNHMVCVDLRNPANKTIHDCLEDHPVRLSEESLACCIGDGVELTHIYARRLSKMPEPTSGKRRRKGNRNARRKSAKEARM